MNALKRFRSSRTRRGYTLLEGMIAMGVCAFAIAGAMSVFIMSQRITYETDRINRIDNEARMFSDRVSKDIRNAAGLMDAYSVYSVTDGHLILRVPSVDANEFILDYVGAATPSDLETFDIMVYHPEEYGELAVIVREVYPDPTSSRERSTQIFGNIVKLNSFFGNFTTVNDALGAFVLQYHFLDSQKFQDKEYQIPVTGSVRLRNKR